jgi:regulator of protease activity HflC (stomatin/prohibitin superfamily)
MVNYSELLDDVPPAPKKSRWWRFVTRHLPSLSVVLMVMMLTATVLYPYVIITVPSGQVGVLWKRFNGFDGYCWCFVGRGTILDPKQLRNEGLHIVWPWDRLFLYDLRLHSTTQTYNAISKDGVSVAAQISIRFQLVHNSIGVLHKFIGPAYLQSVVSPEIGSQAREVVSQYTAQQVYTSREEIQEKIRNSSQKSLGTHLNNLIQPDAMEQPDPKHYNDFLQNSIQILDTLVLSIELPPAIVAAINRQTEQYYQIQEYKFRVEREAQESKRKQIEANGIAAFQRTVSQGISDSYLRWRGIEATLALAQSPNTKIVIIGNSKDGLPIILGNVDSPASPVLGPKPAEGQTAPGDRPPATSPPPPSTPPAGSSSAAPPPDTPAGGAAAAADKKTDAPASSDKQTGSYIPLDLAELKAILSRISEGLHPAGSGTTSGTGAQPKQ